jgi:glycosyltransferase involved in cell wall biosynthesis
MTSPRLSIITVCYNSVTTIGDTLRSVAQQNYLDYEHVLVDGGSTDGTVQLIVQFAAQHPEKRIRWKSAPDKGLYDAMNKGINWCEGDYIGILNADDFYAHNEVLSEVMHTIDKNNALALYADLDYVDAQSVHKTLRKWHSGFYKRNSFLWGWMPPHPTFFVHKSLYQQFGTFRLDLKSAADYELMLRFIHKHEVKPVYLPDTIIHMRAGGISNASFGNRLAANKMDRKAWKVNGLSPYFFTLWLKPLRKIGQFFSR